MMEQTDTDKAGWRLTEGKKKAGGGQEQGRRAHDVQRQTDD